MRAPMSSAAFTSGRDIQSSPSTDRRRASAIHTTLAGVLSSISVTLGGMIELTREAEKPKPESVQVIRTIDELRDMLRDEFHLELLFKSAGDGPSHSDAYEYPTVGCESIKTGVPQPTLSTEMNDESEGIILKTGRLILRTGEWIGKKWGQTKAVVSYVSHYRMSEQQVTSDTPQDCNDAANIFCEKMSKRFGLPMHLISVWPMESHQRLSHSWHQFAACRMDDGRYLIMDKHIAVLWDGTLEEYAREHPCDRVPTSVIPILGKAEYREPEHDCVVSKVLLQIKHIIPHEEEMRSLQLQPAYAESTLARRP